MTQLYKKKLNSITSKSLLVLCKKTSDYYCADIELLYRVVSVVQNSSTVISSDLVIINVFGNISFVGLMGFSVTVMQSARCCQIYKPQQLHKLLENHLSIFHLLLASYNWDQICHVIQGKRMSYSNTTGCLDTQHEGIFYSAQVRKVQCAETQHSLKPKNRGFLRGEDLW